LEPLYHLLIKHSVDVYMGYLIYYIKEVRRPIAYSFHQVAQILGPELTQTKLFSLLYKIL
jgi:hypothetical protein